MTMTHVTPSGRPTLGGSRWRAMNMVVTAPATSGGPGHDFQSGTAIAAILAVMALRDAPRPAEPARRNPTKEN